jgi:hypothetical protein
MKIALFCIISFCFCSKIQAQKIKFDTTMKIGKVGYRVICSNKNNDKNPLKLSLIGFEENRGDIDVEVKGKVLSAEVDDVNNDGFPDLLMYIYTEGDKRKGTVLAIASDNNKSVLPIIFPDILDDEKLKVGYNGGDEFRLLNGRLLRKFPVYNTTDSSANSTTTGVVRQVIYRVIYGEKGALKFKVDRSFDTNKP